MSPHRNTIILSDSDSDSIISIYMNNKDIEQPFTFPEHIIVSSEEDSKVKFWILMNIMIDWIWINSHKIQHSWNLDLKNLIKLLNEFQKCYFDLFFIYFHFLWHTSTFSFYF